MQFFTLVFHLQAVGNGDISTHWVTVGWVPNAACTASQGTGTQSSSWCLQRVKCSATAEFELQIISAFTYFFKLIFKGAFDSRKNYPQLHKLSLLSVCSELCAPHVPYCNCLSASDGLWDVCRKVIPAKAT